MEIVKLLISPLIVGIFMFMLNKNQRKRDETEEAKLKEFRAKEQKHLCMHQMHTKGVLLSIESTKLALESLKKLRDEKGKALLNGELAAMNKAVGDFKKEFENFIIEK